MVLDVDLDRAQIAGAFLAPVLAAAGISSNTSRVPAILDLLNTGPAAGAAAEGPTPGRRVAFGVTEFSISLAADRAPSIRCLAEVISRHPGEEPDIEAGLTIGTGLLAFLAEPVDAAYLVERFQQIYRCVYARSVAAPARPDYRFGLAVEWSRERPPSVKSYFDLFTGGRAQAFARLRALFELLEFSEQWLLFDELASALGDRELCRGVGVDFGPEQGTNCRLYLAGKHFTLATIERLLDRFGQHDQSDALGQFRRWILDAVPASEPLRSSLVGLVFADRLPPDRPLVKLDAYLPDLKPDDQAAAEAAGALCSALGLSTKPYDDMLAVLAAGRALDATQGLQQFLSLDLLPQGRSKVNVYFRPIGLETPHLSPRHRPRSKQAQIAEIDRAARRTIGWLERSRAGGYAEATHHMHFPRAAGFTGCNDRQEGWVFQRALIADALLDAAAAGYTIDWGGITDDVFRLLGARCRDVRGGWRYFPDLPELPPDADDLAAMLLVLVRSGAGCVAVHCDDAIQLLFEQNAAPDGSFSTWIVDRADPRPPSVALLDAIATKWGDSPDVEVIANLLYAVHRYDPARFAAEVGRGAAYVAARQQPDGSWQSSWYCGRFNGTFAATRLLTAVEPGNHTLPAAARFLASCQCEDGGWGDGDGGSTATDTALGLSSLACLRHAVTVDPAVCQRAAAYLVTRQSPEGVWPASAFIQMDTNRIETLAGQGQPRIITYRSTTITSAICLKALCLARPVLANAT